ncbi:unnamed protein product [Caenorhabditis brenneri]
MDARFPLLKLPDKASRRVLQVMNTEEILGFSLISKKCKELTISSKIRSSSISVTIGNEIELSFVTIRGCIMLKYYTEPRLDWIIGTNGQKKTLKPPESVVVTDWVDLNELKWSNEKDFGMEEWLDHIQTVFDNRQTGHICFQRNASRFDIDYVKETFGNTHYLSVGHSGSFDYNESILKKFLPTEWLHIEANAFPDSKIPSRILIQNFENLDIKCQEVGLECISLDDLLMINSEYIKIHTDQKPVKMLNKFVKLWKKGANPRMKSFRIMYHNGSETDIDVILNGIKCNEVQQERLQYTLVNKGFYTYKMDGTKATIKFVVKDYSERMTVLRIVA